MRQYNFPKKSLLALLIPTMMCHTMQAHADDSLEPEVHLGHETITISRTPQEEVGEEIVTRHELNEQMVQNSHDLVRYNTEVDVAEVGRYGNKGFAIRGVDGNRVAMSIDDVALPEIEVNELYSPYGYTYEGRFSPDLELMSSVRIQAGADSLTSGSGAVGGAVNYRTKSPSNLVKSDNTLGGYAKVGYTSKNEEKLGAVGLAGITNKTEFLINYAHRKGHELKNHDMRSHSSERLNNILYDFGGLGELGSRYRSESALYPDSAEYQRDAVLGKAYYHLNDEHRLGVHGMYQKQKTQTNAYSKITGGGLRMANDTEEMKSYGINYQYLPSQSKWLDQLNIDYTHQDILGLAHTDIYTSSGFYKGLINGAHHRPTETLTDKIKTELRFTPIDFENFGSHQLSLSGYYSKQDYKATKVELNIKPDTGALIDAFQSNIIPFTDAKKDNYSITLSDDIRFNDRFNATLGIRYDYFKYAPYFQDDVFFGDPQSSEINTIHKNINSPITFYKDYRDGVYNQKPTFDKLTYNGLFEYDVISDKLTARYKVGTGFLAPSVTQMYSAFEGMGVQQIINTQLKPETSLNNEIELEFNLSPITLNVSAYQTDYKNFIHTQWWDRWDARQKSNDCTQSTCLQSINLDEAKVQGIKVGVRADLSRWLDGTKLYLTADYHDSKDKAKYTADQAEDGVLEINNLASTPTTTILGFDYYTPDDKATLHLKARHIKAKSADDTKMVETVWDRSRATGYREQVGTYQHIDKSTNAFVFDVYGSYKINNHLKLQAGVYNLTDEKYIPWETLRQFAVTNINSFIDRDGYGFNRYTAPGRNYALSLTYEF